MDGTTIKTKLGKALFAHPGDTGVFLRQHFF
jgi:hypothetical protein